MILIDANALKEDVRTILGDDITSITILKLFEEIIDKATPIDSDEIYKKGYHAGFFATHDDPIITDNDIQEAITAGYKEGYEMAKAKYKKKHRG